MADVNAPSGQTPTMAPPNLSQHSSGKKRATLIVIPSIRFTKLIIHHLQRKHMFHPRPDSAFHLANDEPVLGYLKFSAKGTKREVFGMPIPGRLITADIREASYYEEYQENVAKHRGFLAGKTGSTQDFPAPKSAKPARKPQSTAQKAPAKSQENKRKQATETTDKPAKAKRIKHSISRKTRQPRSSPKSVGASEAKETPAEEPQVTDEDTDYQKAVEESMKDAYALPKGPLLPVVIKEPESGKYQPLSEVPEKGKAKVTKEQVAHDLLSLQKHKKTCLADQYIFQRRVSKPTGSSGHDESPYALLGQSDDEEESKKLVFGAKEGGQDEDREHMDLDAADVSPQPSTEQLDEGFTAMVYLNVQENLKLVVEEPVLLEEPASSSGTLSSLQHLKTEVESMVNVTIQQALSSISLMTSPIIDLTSRPESPKEHQQLKANTTDTTTTTTTLPPSQALQQIMTEAMMVKRIGKLEHILADLVQVNKNMEERLDKHGARLYTLEQLDIPQQVSIAISEVVTDAVDWAMQAPLGNCFRDLLEADMKEILHQRMWESDSYKSHKDHMQLFEALEKSINRDHSEELAQDLAEARKKNKKRRESPKTLPGSPSHQPPPPPPPAGPSGALRALRASGSAQMPPSPPPPSSTNQESLSKGSAEPSPSKTAASAEYQAWTTTTTDIRLRPSISLTPADLEMDEDMAPDEQAQSLDDEDLGSAHIPMVNLRQGWWKPFEEERPTTPEPAWSIRSSNVPVPMNNWASALASNYSPHSEDSLLTMDDPILRHNVSKPLPLRGPPGQVTIQSDIFFNKDLEYLRYGSKGRRPALSISKMKAAYYPDAGLEQMVPDQFWIEEECKYDIATMWQSAPASDHSKSKRTIESRAKRSSKIISLGHYFTLLSSSYTVKSKAYFKSPTHYPCGIARTSE
nr:hypothetical protein [Tanacetum cinerariifolium]